MSITINGATNTLTAASGLTIAGNTAVTGTLSASGDVTFAGATSGILNVNATGTNATRLSLLNDGGQYFFGVDNSTGAGFGGTAYAQVIYAPAGRVVETSIAGTGVITKVSSTGLAVTGTLSATSSTDSTVAAATLENSSTGTSAITRLRINGGTSIGVLELFGSGYSGAGLTGGPTTSSLNLWTATNLPVCIGVNAAAVGTFSSTGLAVTGLLDLSAASSGQIKFPATQNASADANTLDDYEEGTWTPNQGGDLTVVGAFSSVGRYTKIGRQVTVIGTVTGATSVAVPAAGAICSNLPFTALAVVGVQAIGAASNITTDASSGVLVNQSTTSLYAVATIAATASIHFTVTYFV